MKYYLKQLLFFIIVSGLYCSIILFWHQQETIFQKEKTLIYFQDIIARKNSLIENLKTDNICDINRTAAIQFELISLVEAIKKNLQKPPDERRFGINSLKLPFGNANGLYMGRNGRIFHESGNPFNNYFTADWFGQFLLGVHNKGTVFESKTTTLYNYLPITYDEFANQHENFYIVNLFGEFFLLFHGEENIQRTENRSENFFYLLITHLNKISNEELRQSVLQRFLNEDKRLKPDPHTDTLTFNQQIIIQSPSTNGVKLEIDTGGLKKSLKITLPCHLIFLIILFKLFRMGGYQIIFMRFEFPFAVKFLLFLLLLFTSFYHYFLNQRQIWQTFLKNNFEKSSQMQMQDIEYGLNDYVSELSKNISESFENDDVFSDHIWDKVFNGVLFNRHKKIIFSRPELGEIIKLGLLGGGTVAIKQQPEYSGNRELSEIDRIYQVEEIRRNFAIPDFLRDKLTEKILSSSKSAFFSESGRKKFVTWQALDEGFLFFWDKRGQNENFELMVASTYTANLQKMYLEELSRKDSESINYIVLEKRNPRYTLNTEKFLQKKELEHLRNLHEQRLNIPFQYHRDNTDYSAVFLPANAFLGFNFLFIIPNQVLYEPLRKFERNFLLFCIFYWSCGIACIIYILKLILQPLSLLKEGLQKINSGESGVLLPVYSADEGGELIRQFNFMSTEMAKTEKMLPYVPESLYALLDQNSELQCDKPWFQGEAAIIFSDIRSFTTISESHDPEIVVRVLNEYFSIWQQKVEKYSGIIDRFIGDAIIVAFFAQNSKHWLQNSVQTALEVLEELELLNRKNNEKIGFSINIGVGITAGNIEIGIIKSQQKTELLMTGKIMQQAEKLESDSKNGKFSHILVSEKIYDKTRFVFDYEPFTSETEPAGKIYEIMLKPANYSIHE